MSSAQVAPIGAASDGTTRFSLSFLSAWNWVTRTQSNCEHVLEVVANADQAVPTSANTSDPNGGSEKPAQESSELVCDKDSSLVTTLEHVVLTTAAELATSEKTTVATTVAATISLTSLAKEVTVVHNLVNNIICGLSFCTPKAVEQRVAFQTLQNVENLDKLLKHCRDQGWKGGVADFHKELVSVGIKMPSHQLHILRRCTCVSFSSFIGSLLCLLSLLSLLCLLFLFSLCSPSAVLFLRLFSPSCPLLSPQSLFLLSPLSSLCPLPSSFLDSQTLWLTVYSQIWLL